MRSAWIIDVDYDADPFVPSGSRGNAAGMIFGTIPGLLDFLNAGGGAKFRMYDDDGELYYEGRWMSNEILDGGPFLSEGVFRALPGDAFAPLDQFGTPNAGCTEIRYLIGGMWVPL